MTVGLPGSGVGGIFYLLGALWMPVVAVGRALRSQQPSWRGVFQQWLLALGIVVGLGVTGWLLGWTLAQTPVAPWAAQNAADAGRIPQVLRTASIVVALGTLFAVSLAVWCGALLLHGRAAFQSVSPETEPTPEAGGTSIARASSDR